MAEYFRDINKQDVLLLIDNIFRFVQAGPRWFCFFTFGVVPLLVTNRQPCYCLGGSATAINNR
jgi:F0F1-type ATP synthase beta subunit